MERWVRRDGADERWRAAGLRGGHPPGLIPFLTSLLGLYGTYKAVEAISAPPPAPAPLSFPPVTPYSSGYIPVSTIYSAPGFHGMDLALPDIRMKIPHWIRDILLTYGPPVAQAVWLEFQKRRRAGQPSGEAKAALMATNPVVHHRHRRRINPTNVRALRRAVRRVRSFQRVSRKVERLMPRRTRRMVSYRRPRRRGDVNPFAMEDYAEDYDTVEDLGYEPSSFQEDDVE